MSGTGNPETDKLMAKAEADEKREADTITKIKKFNPAELLIQKTFTAVDSELGEVTFTDITIGESLELLKVEDQKEKELRTLYYMLKKNYPEMKFEDFKKTPQSTIIRLCDLVKKAPFLQLINKT